ncbi:hypothetical protein AMR72_11460 [Flavobacterium psychrophilum]|nr:hypothetical protein AMR72_11460 [Flavobacterium psychrophilum]AOE53078.1 hypothetical protein ALW18_11450 [Flavobacterium psychrophilum]
MQYWIKLTKQPRTERIQAALSENVNFSTDASLGYPASKLNGKVFYDDAPFLKDAPVLQTFVANPNHIGQQSLVQDRGDGSCGDRPSCKVFQCTSQSS